MKPYTKNVGYFLYQHCHAFSILAIFTKISSFRTHIFKTVENTNFWNSVKPKKKTIINTLNFIQYWRIFHQNFIFQETYYSTPWIITSTTSDIIKQPAVDAEDDNDIGTIVGVIIALLLVALIAGILLVYMR